MTAAPLTANIVVPAAREEGALAPRRSWFAVITLVVGAVLAVVSLPLLAQAKSTVFGLLFSGAGGVMFALALAASALSFVVFVRIGAVRGAVFALVVSVLTLRLPTALSTSEPLYSWTYKHLGVIDYIQQHGSVTAGIDIYSGWPGMFSAVAWFSTITGITPLAIAQWFPVLVNICLVGLVYALSRTVGTDVLPSVVAAFIASVANWVGQDYLSPQAVAYLLALAVLVLLLGSRARPALAWLSVPLFCAVTVTHQLTPYWLIAVTIALGITGRIRPRYIGLLFGTIAGGYLALNYATVAPFGLFSSPDPLANAQTVSLGVGSDGETLTALSARWVAGVLWVASGAIAATAVVRVFVARRSPTLRRRSRFRSLMHPDVLTAPILAFGSFVLLAGQSYGGEALFRVFLYSIPGCAILCAKPLTYILRSTPHSASASGSVRPSLVRKVFPVLTSVGVIATLVVSGQAVYGAWFSNVVQENAVVNAEQELRTLPVPSLIVSPVAAGPGRLLGQYAAQAKANPQYDASFTTWEGWTGRSFETAADESKLTDQLSGTQRPVYFVLTKQMIDAAQYQGLFPDGALERFADQLAVDNRWAVVVDEPGLRVFKLETTS